MVVYPVFFKISFRPVTLISSKLILNSHSQLFKFSRSLIGALLDTQEGKHVLKASDI